MQLDGVAAAQIAEERSVLAEQTAGIEGGHLSSARSSATGSTFAPGSSERAELLEVQRVQDEARATRREGRCRGGRSISGTNAD